MKNVLRWLKSLLSMVFHFRHWMHRKTSSLKDDDNKVTELGQKASLYLRYYYLNKLKEQVNSNELTNEDVKALLSILNYYNQSKDKNERGDLND